MHSPGINGEGELRGQSANPGSPGKMAVKTECVFFWKSSIVYKHWRLLALYYETLWQVLPVFFFCYLMLYVETITNFIDNYQLLFWTHSWANIITLIILAYFQLIGLVMAEKNSEPVMAETIFGWDWVLTSFIPTTASYPLLKITT